MAAAGGKPDSYFALYRSTSEHILAAKLGAVAARMVQFLELRFFNNSPDDSSVKFTNKELSEALDFKERAIGYAIRDLERAQIIEVEYQRNRRVIRPGVAFWAKKDEQRIKDVALGQGQLPFDEPMAVARPTATLTALPRPVSTPIQAQPMRKAVGAEMQAVTPIKPMQPIQPKQVCGVGKGIGDVLGSFFMPMQGLHNGATLACNPCTTVQPLHEKPKEVFYREIGDSLG